MLKSLDKGKQLIGLTFIIKFGVLYLMLYCKNLDMLQHNTDVIEVLELRNINICTLMYKNIHTSVQILSICLLMTEEKCFVFNKVYFSTMASMFSLDFRIHIII